MNRIVIGVFLAVLVSPASVYCAEAEGAIRSSGRTESHPAELRIMSLEECLNVALQQNRRRPISQFALAVAEAQHRQALSGYWPQISLKGGYERLSDPLNFLFPSSSYAIPAQSVSIPGGTMLMTMPTQAGPVQIPIDVPGQTITTSPTTITVPQQNVTIMGQNLVSSGLNMQWLLYDGGMRKGFREQANGGIGAAQADAKRTDLEITESVKRMYWSAVLARNLHQLGQDTLSRMQVTLGLAERLYKEGSGRVTKTDYLDCTVMAETMRSMVADLEKNVALAEAALANTSGYGWNVSIQPSAEEIPSIRTNLSLEDLVNTTFQFNPDWTKVEAGIRAAEGSLRTARSGYYPKVALSGELRRWWNGGYASGLATRTNENGWTFSIGMEVPIFNGLRTQGEISEAFAKLNSLKQSKLLLQDGLGLQVKSVLVGLDAAQKSQEASLKARDAARQNLDLNTRAYESELVDTDKVTKAQLMEALMSAQFLKAQFECARLRSQLELLVGTDIQSRLDAKR